MSRTQLLKILVVDDDEIDRQAVFRGFAKADIDCQIEGATDGIEALEILRGEGDSELEPPYVVLLDLNMPRMDGIGFLEELRADDKLRRTIVFVLSTSDSEEDQLRAYDQLIAGYIVKSSAGRDFRNLAEMIANYWKIIAPPTALLSCFLVLKGWAR